MGSGGVLGASWAPLRGVEVGGRLYDEEGTILWKRRRRQQSGRQCGFCIKPVIPYRAVIIEYRQGSQYPGRALCNQNNQPMP